MARLVLVHGAFSGAWCWEPIVAPLQALGHGVETFDLPGSGGDRTPIEGVTLDAYAQRICEVAASRPERAVLVGHSMGGVAVTQAAARDATHIGSLIYLTAFAPLDGQSLVDLSNTPEGAGDQIQANIVVSGDPPVAVLPDAAARDAVYRLCTDEQAAWAIPQSRPQAVVPFATPVSLGAADLTRLPRAYITCSEDRSIPYALQRRMIADNGIERVIALHADHAPYLSATDEVVQALDALATAPTDTAEAA